MKRLIIFIIVGLVMFGAGFGGGMVVGRMMAPEDENKPSTRDVPPPGPIASIGEFTSNLAGPGRHVASFTLSLEVLNEEAFALVQTQGWVVRIRNEIFLIVKDRAYEDLNSAEGMLQFAGDIKRSLNAILPDFGGEAPVVQVLFENIVTQ